MNSEQFAYWLQGFLEVANPKTLNETETAMIKEHLQLVFKKVTGPTSIVQTFPWNPQGGGTTTHLNQDKPAIVICASQESKKQVFC